MTIVPGKDYRGKVEPDEEPREDFEDNEDGSKRLADLRKQIMLLQAGPAAEAIHLRACQEANAYADNRMIAVLATGDFSADDVESMRNETCQLLEAPANRRILLAVASELMRWETLYYADVVRLFEAHPHAGEIVIPQ